jgi:hypothetical protein
MITIEGFWKIDDLIKAKWGKKAYKYINYCGLEPVRPPHNIGYFCTPKNSLTFATTGGDGVHFGIVNGINLKGNVGPIVMTVPMAQTNNVVVAEDLEEFFSIGYYVGWFALEQIVYDLDDAITHFSKSDEDMEKEALLFLEIIRKELTFNHIPLSKQRLNELERSYFERLEIDEL